MPTSYRGFASSSERASAAARGASKKRDTRCETLLRKRLWSRGLRYRIAVKSLSGKPDIVFPAVRLAVFCDGDFWHGRNWEQRQLRLRDGSNPAYWLAKIARNMERDRANDSALSAQGWTVLRLWEGDILKAPDQCAQQVVDALLALTSTPRRRGTKRGDGA